jgi:kynurenine formamidase
LDNGIDHGRPADTLLLKEDISVIEDLMGLGQLLEGGFTFFVVPVKVSGTASFRVTTFALME